MAGLIGEGTDQAEMLMRRLRRLAIRADRVDAGDRAKIIALIDDVETVRQCALRECVRLDEDMRRSSDRIKAISAYARGARAIRAPHRRGN